MKFICPSSIKEGKAVIQLQNVLLRIINLNIFGGIMEDWVIYSEKNVTESSKSNFIQNLKATKFPTKKKSSQRNYNKTPSGNLSTKTSIQQTSDSKLSIIHNQSFENHFLEERYKEILLIFNINRIRKPS